MEKLLYILSKILSLPNLKTDRKTDGETDSKFAKEKFIFRYLTKVNLHDSDHTIMQHNVIKFVKHNLC